MTDKAKILIVDDEPFNVDVLEQEVEDLGCIAITARNGQEALDKIAADPPDLVLLDVMMPVMDGFTCCRRIKDDEATHLIPVVIMTALDAKEDRIRGIEAGADDFLTKPVDDRELRARIQTALRMKKALDSRINRLEQRGDHLAKFVPDLVRRRIDANPAAPQLEKREQDASVVFVDIVGYTKMSEQMSPDALSAMVEGYFSVFMDLIHERGGEISETSGDGLMIIFLDPDPARHPRCAVEATLAMFAATLRMNAERPTPPVRLHAGINTGIAAVGSTRYEGSRGSRWVFTADGLTANLAARLAGGAPAGEIHLGPETAARVRDAFPLRSLGGRTFKNIAEPIEVFRVEATATGTDPDAATTSPAQG